MMKTAVVLVRIAVWVKVVQWKVVPVIIVASVRIVA